MILVTGASGFVGAQLTRKLAEEGGQVRALYHRNPPTAAMQSWKGVDWHQADLLDIFAADEAMQGIRQVYHCAAVVSFNPARREELIHVNTETTANVVNAALEAGVEKLVHLSSVAALGRDGSNKEINEEAQWEESRHNSGYGMSKYQAEMEVWRGMGEGLQGIVLNPGIILGEAQSVAGWQDGSARLMHLAHKEFPFFTEGINAFVDVQDVVDAAIRLMESALSGERYIVSAGNFPYREIFTMMAGALGKKPPRFRAGKLLTGLLWRFSALQSAVTGKPVTITRETARNAQTKCYYSQQKLLAALPDFKYRPMQSTIERMAGAYQNAFQP